MTKLVVATRRSALALAQTRAFVRALVEAHRAIGTTIEVEELQIVTSGDRIQDRPLYEVGGKGLFVKEIEEALLDRRADFAVHSMKDLPAHLPPRLAIVCTPARADPRDLLVVPPNRTPVIADLPANARVGSSSLRRRVALQSIRADLVVEPLRGNVDTRIKRVVAGDFDAIVLAAAGVARLGVDPRSLPPHRPIPIETMLPAVAQGILAIEARDDDDAIRSILAPLHDRDASIAADAERGVLRSLGADCTVPLAAHAVVEGDRVHLRAWLHDEGARNRRTIDATIDSRANDVAQTAFDLGARHLASPRDAR